MIELIIFDMDGVIVQTHQTSSLVMRGVVKDLFKIDVTSEDVQNFYGFSDAEFYTDIITRSGSNMSLADVLDEQFARYNSKLENEVEPTVGVVSLIKKLATTYQVAICSGSTREQVNIVIERFGLEVSISTSIACDDVSKGKPDPAGYQLVLQKLNKRPEQVITIEDSPAGIEAAQAAGVKVIGFNNGLDQDISRANFRIDDMSEIEDIINQN